MVRRSTNTAGLSMQMHSVLHRRVTKLYGKSWNERRHSERCNTSPVFWLGRLAFVSDGVSNNGRSEAERPPTSVGPPSGGRAAFQTPLHSLYSTRPHGLVQAIFWHTCPDLDLGPWYCLTHWTHIALSGSMTSRIRVSARSRPSPPLYPHFNWPSGFWPCVKSCLVGGSDKYIHSVRCNTSPTFWLGRLAFVWDGVSKNGRFEAERPPTSVGPASGGRAATFVPYV